MTTLESNITAICNYMDSEGLNYTFDRERNEIIFFVSGNNDNEILIHRIDISENGFLSHVYCGKCVDTESSAYSEMCKYFNHLNAIMIYGAFSADPKDGKLIYRYGVPTDDTPTEERLRDLIYLPAAMMSGHRESIYSIISGGTAKNALIIDMINLVQLSNDLSNI